MRPDTPFVEWSLDRALPAVFEAVAARHADRLAVKDGDRSVTYGELNRAANRLAHVIVRELGTDTEPVVFCLEHGLPQIIAMLGILKAGKIYLPLDPSYPKDLLADMLEASGTRLAVTSATHRNTLLAGRAAGLTVMDIDEIAEDGPDDDPRLALSPDALALIYYTSGSKGRPKGVVHTHRSTLHFAMLASRDWRPDATDRVAHLVPAGFSAAPMTVFTPLLNGAVLAPFDLKASSLSRLVEWLKRERVSIYFSVPSVFRHVIAALGERDSFPDLRLIVLGGEPLYRKDFEDFKRRFPDRCVLLNILAGTEMFYIRSHALTHESSLDDDVVPVGYPVPGKAVVLLDDEGREVPAGEVGEITVRSRYLSPGYWKQDDLTRAAFRDVPREPGVREYRSGDLGRMKADGNLVHVGRKDSLVKIRGQRVELGAVETAILDTGLVREAVVVPKPDHQGTVSLVAYVVPSSASGFSVELVRSRLSAACPSYAIPSVFERLEALPKTPSGKVDRLALPSPGAGLAPPRRTPPVAPRDDLETRVLGVCQTITGVDAIGITDSLFDLGVDSLRYVSLLLEIEQELGRRLPSGSFPREATVEHLASAFRVQDRVEADGGASAASVASDGDRVRAILDRFRIAGTMLFARVIPYRVGVRTIARFSGLRFVQRRLFRARVARLREVMRIEGARHDERAVIRRFLAQNLFRNWKYACLGRMPAEEMSAWITVGGLGHVRESLAAGRGVIVVNSHLSLAHLVSLVLVRSGFNDVLTMQNSRRIFTLLGLAASQYITLLEMQPRSRNVNAWHLFAARQVLQRGGLVHLAGDGYQGEAGVTLRFLDRPRCFRTGFGDLAVATGASVIPAFVTAHASGEVAVEFRPPLSRDARDASPAMPVEALTRSYVDLLQEKWRSDPSNVTPLWLKRFSAIPKGALDS